MNHSLRNGLILCAVWALACGAGCGQKSQSPGSSFAAQRESLSSKKGQAWTVQCIEIRGPYANSHIDQLADTLRRTPGIRAKDVFSRRNPDGSCRLYYGVHYRKTDPQTGKRSMPRGLRDDLMHIKELTDNNSKHIFLHAMFVPMPQEHVGNPEWSLLKASGVYTLQVAVFLPTDTFQEYRQAAAEYCSYLRGEGFEAYYFHGQSSSMVTVGSFGKSAVVAKSGEVPLDSTGQSGEVIITTYSAEVLALQEHELLKYNLVNGAKIRERSGNRLGSPVTSRLVHIPDREEVAPW